jgi:glycosyltransferase involved in cell wall biosynthesis
VVWQPCLRRLADSDLVIVEQANSLLLNYWLLAARRVTGRRLAYWGHGRNFQEKGEGGLRSFLKSVLITQADWWFAYTELSAMIVRASGFPEERISTVNNSIDNEDFRKALEAISPDKVRRLKEELGIDGNRVGIYCGGLYTDKRIDFLLESCNKVRNRLNDFHLIIIGSGPEQEKVARAAEECPWIHYVGARFGNDRAPYFKASEILLMPGLVGLAIIDAFTAGTPIFTTDIPIHSPEIAYLSAGLNGFMTAYDTDAYAESVTSYFELHDQREPIRQACLASAKTFGFDQFVGNFSDGIARCLLGST